jgi:hypothetical protein
MSNFELLKVLGTGGKMQILRLLSAVFLNDGQLGGAVLNQKKKMITRATGRA